jgi:hypothetical protein
VDIPTTDAEKIIKEIEEEENKVMEEGSFKEYSEWCDDKHEALDKLRRAISEREYFDEQGLEAIERFTYNDSLGKAPDTALSLDIHEVPPLMRAKLLCILHDMSRKDFEEIQTDITVQQLGL